MKLFKLSVFVFLFIHFDGVYHQSDVYFNGKHLEFYLGYIGF